MRRLCWHPNHTTGRGVGEVKGEEELCLPRSFDFGGLGGGAGRETTGAGAVNPFGAVGMLGVTD